MRMAPCVAESPVTAREGRGNQGTIFDFVTSFSPALVYVDTLAEKSTLEREGGGHGGRMFVSKQGLLRFGSSYWQGARFCTSSHVATHKTVHPQGLGFGPSAEDRRRLALIPRPDCCNCCNSVNRSRDLAARAKPPQSTAHEQYTVSFTVPECRVDYGDQVFVVGNIPELGNWNAEGGFPLQWTDGDTWEGRLSLSNLHAHQQIEYKLVKYTARNGSFVWEDGENRKLVIRSSTAPSPTVYSIVCLWNQLHAEGFSSLIPTTTGLTGDEIEMTIANVAGKAESIKAKQRQLNDKVSSLEEKLQLTGTKLRFVKASMSEKEDENSIHQPVDTWRKEEVEQKQSPSPSKLPNVKMEKDGSMIFEFDK